MPLPTTGLDFGPPPKGWDRDTWTLRQTLTIAVKRLPRSSAPARVLDGCAMWLAFSGHKTKGPWWAKFLQMLSIASELCGDEPSQRLLAPWTQAVPAGTSGFRPFDGSES